MALPLTTWPVRGQRLEAVLAQGCEVDGKVDRAKEPLGDAFVLQVHDGQAKNGLGQNICSARVLANRCKSAPSPEAVGTWSHRGELALGHAAGAFGGVGVAGIPPELPV
jgi:hypothetical protein